MKKFLFKKCSSQHFIPDDGFHKMNFKKGNLYKLYIHLVTHVKHQKTPCQNLKPPLANAFMLQLFVVVVFFLLSLEME